MLINVNQNTVVQNKTNLTPSRLEYREEYEIITQAKSLMTQHDATGAMSLFPLKPNHLKVMRLLMPGFVGRCLTLKTKNTFSQWRIEMNEKYSIRQASVRSE